MLKNIKKLAITVNTRRWKALSTILNTTAKELKYLKVLHTRLEAPKGEFGVSLISDGSSLPYRCKIRTPAYHHMQVMPRMVQGHFFADLVTVLGSQDIVFGDVDR